MPADKDTREAFESEYGSPAGTAEDIIAAHQRLFSGKLREASLKPLNPQATEALDEGKVQKACDKGERVLTAAVRGSYVIVVVEDEEGRWSKRVFDAADVGPSDAEIAKVRENPPATWGQPKKFNEPKSPEPSEEEGEAEARPERKGAEKARKAEK